MTPRSSSLRRRMIMALLACFIPMILVITLLFQQALRERQRAQTESLRYTAQDISRTLDRYVAGVYSVSDAFSTDQSLLDMLEADYASHPLSKKWAITYINGALFESYNRLLQQKKIDAIYLTNRQDVFDFLDPNQDVPMLIEKLEALGVNDKDKLGRFYWYPLADNFLTTSSYDETRRDHVVLGSRRVYSSLKSGYPYVHLFAVEEQTLYDLYSLQAMRLGATVYILDENGGLISSTDEGAVAACALPDPVAESYAALESDDGILPVDGETYSMARADCSQTNWTTLVMVPTATLSGETAQLYLQILVVIGVCMVVAFALVLLLYRRFMAPLAQLEQSIRRVDAGDLRAYVKPQGPAELVQMLQSYNTMLDSIRVSMQQQLEMSRRKQDLEMQVLMSQINPHFLYNTLETIVWKAGEAGRTDIGKLAASLGKLYRLSISGGLFVPLQQELQHVQMYMNIQQSRYGNKVACDVRLHGCDAAEVETLKLVLQPIVENCLLYGMEGLDHTLRIRITVRRRGDWLEISVTDNGIGMDEATLEALRDQIAHGRKPGAEKNRRSTGIGLHNIQARLQLYAGAKSGLTVWSLPGVGTRVTLTQPWRPTGERSPQ